MVVEATVPTTDEFGRAGSRERPEVRAVRLSDLSVGYSPREQLLDEEHVSGLMEVIDRLPPIIIEGRTNRVLDGVHRLEAFRRAGRTEIQAVVFSGTETEALVVAVQANIKHGKPLSRGERHAAAATLLRACPERSDRWVADVCGLSHSTVARVRQAAGTIDSILRTGRDGRRRPVDATRGRAAVARALEEAPGSSVRQVAQAAGVTPSTAQRTAAQLRARSERASSQPVLGAPEPAPAAGTDGAHPGPGPVSEKSGVGDWLARTAVAPGDLGPFLADMPLNRAYEVADECWRRAATWADMAAALEKHVRARRGAWPGHEG